ncbi:hypothetical protein Syun_006647 [Stephania yunnanensis]|uniref:Uncharacterized protein n=1 Tax=Stephania yunnanensis TaxID=152371 RepID=A0AAP0KX97_9MAGN
MFLDDVAVICGDGVSVVLEGVWMEYGVGGGVGYDIMIWHRLTFHFHIQWMVCICEFWASHRIQWMVCILWILGES